jgi:hypothetical protein
MSGHCACGADALRMAAATTGITLMSVLSQAQPSGVRPSLVLGVGSLACCVLNRLVAVRRYR